jgi:hypothetical protein
MRLLCHLLINIPPNLPGPKSRAAHYTYRAAAMGLPIEPGVTFLLTRAGGRGLHSSTILLYESTICGIGWAHDFPPDC